MGVLSLANVFTGMAVDFGRLKKVVSSRDSKHPLTKLPFIDVGSVTPSIIGSRSVANVDETKLREVDDDRWCQVEGGSPSRMHRCSACTFLCAEHELRCAACGTLRPVESSADRFHCSTPKNSSSPEITVTTTVVPDEVSPELTVKTTVVPDGVSHEAPEHAALSREAVVAKSPEPTEDAQHEDGDHESEGEEINGTLDVPPTPGTQVKVLFDDDRWHLAQVLVTRNARARVRFENGEQAMLDFEVDAVRLASYTSDDEEDDQEEDGEDGDIEEEKEEDNEATDDKHSEAEEAGPEDKTVADCEPDLAQVNEEDYDSDEEQIEGTLDDAPPVGTLVKVLYDDDTWYQARVTETKGTKAVVVFQDNEEEELNFEEHAVRLFVFVDQNEKIATTRPENHSREHEPNQRIAEELQIGAEATSRTDEAVDARRCEALDEISAGEHGQVASASIIGRVSDA